MWEIIRSGGLLMLPIILMTVAVMYFVADRWWHLRKKKVLPDNLVAEVWRLANTRKLTEEKMREVQSESPLGRILVAGMLNRQLDRESMKASIEEVGSHVAHELERNLNALGTIAAVAPLVGLLGTVVGMISVFTNITTVGVGNPTQLAGGISQALMTTAGGLIVAIPALIAYRYFRRRVDGLVVSMEKEALKLVDVIQRRNAANQTRKAA